MSGSLPEPGHPRRSWLPVTWGPLPTFLVIGALYFLLANSAYELFGALTLGVTFFPPAGLTFAAFFALPRRLWPAIAAAIVVGEIAVDLGQGQGFWWACGWAAANLSEPFVGANLTRRLGGGLDLTRRTLAAMVVGGLVVGPIVGASIGATTLAIANDISWTHSFPDIWVGDSLGVLIVAPAALLFGVAPTFSMPHGRDLLDALVSTVLVLIMCVLFWTSDDPAVAYAAIPLLLWCALRNGARGLSLAALAIAAAATAATAEGHGPWRRIAGSDVHDQLGHQQFFLLVAVGGAWLLTVEVRERTRAIESMNTIASDAALLRRAVQAGRMGVWRWNVETGRVAWDEDLERLYGLEPGAFGGTLEAWSSVVPEYERDRVFSEMRAAIAQRRPFRVQHDCVWPDGSVHAVEAAGEVALDANGSAIGAFGVSVDVDHRRQVDIERNRVLELERTARHRADLRAQVNAAIGYSLDLDELAERVVDAAVPALGDWSSLILTLDQPPEQPIIAATHVEPSGRDWSAEYRERIPFDPDFPQRAPWVIRTGRTIFAPDLADELLESALPDDDQRAFVRELGVRSSIVVALPSPLGVVGAWELARGASSPPYTEADVALAEDLARVIGAAVNSAMLHRRQVRAQRALDTLQSVTGRLATAVTVDEIVGVVVSHGAQGVAADSAMLYLLDDSERLHLAANAGIEHIDVSSWRQLSLTASSPVTDAVHDRKVVVLSDLSDMHLRYPSMRPPESDEAAIIALPIAVRQETVGALVLTFRRAHHFYDDEIAMLETLAGRCAGAIVRARLYETQRTAALALQRRLLPELPAVPSWLDIGARYEPAAGGEVGGDWYQVMMLDDGRCAAALGDAVGRGITAAAAMGQLRAAIAGAAGVDAHPSAVVAATSRLASVGADTRCASLAYALIDPQAGTVTYALAGHPSPVLVRANGEVLLLEGGRSPLLGTTPSGDALPFATAEFRPGDTLVLFSDGLVERRGEAIDDGLARLAQRMRTLAHLSAATIASELVDAIAGDEVNDDVAVLVLHVASSSLQAC